MKFLKLVLGDAMADIGMGDLDFDRLNQLGIQDDISSDPHSNNENDNDHTIEPQLFKLPQLYKLTNADVGMTEHVYKLTELYLPTNTISGDLQQKRDLEEYLQRQIRGSGDLTLTEQENQWKRKREIKEQMKLAGERTVLQCKVQYVASQKGPCVVKIEKWQPGAVVTDGENNQVRGHNQNSAGKINFQVGKRVDWLQEASLDELKSEFRMPTQLQSSNSKIDMNTSICELSSQQRKKVVDSLKKQANSSFNQQYPSSIQLTQIELQCLSYLENPQVVGVGACQFNNSTTRYMGGESGDSDLLMSYEGNSNKSIEQEPISVVQLLGKRRTTQKYWGELSDLTSIHSHTKSVLRNRKQAKPCFKVVNTTATTPPIDKPMITHQNVSACDIIAATKTLIQAEPADIKNRIEMMMSRPAIKSVRMQENLDYVFQRQKMEYKLLKGGKSLPFQQEGSRLEQASGIEDDQKNSQSSITDDPEVPDSKICQQLLQHAHLSQLVQFVRFEWSHHQLENFKKPDISKLFKPLLDSPAQKKQLSTIITLTSSGVIVQSQGAQLPLKILPFKAVKQNLNGAQYFKNKKKLTKRGELVLYEHVDKTPTYMLQVGMASKLRRFGHVGESKLPHIGTMGDYLRRSKDQSRSDSKLPLLGQLDKRGIAILSNQLYHMPVFFQKQLSNDFFCTLVFPASSSNPSEIYIQEVSHLYSAGQQEPLKEVINPFSRNYHYYVKQKAQTYISRILQENKNVIFNDVHFYFPQFGEQVLKKFMRESHIEVKDQVCFAETDFKNHITLEQICQYEASLQGDYCLKKLGLEDVGSLLIEKLSAACNRLCQDEVSTEIRAICRLIEERVLATPWNLSTSYIQCKQSKQMMLLEGIGDPTNGNGGLSFLKMPLKVKSEECLNTAKDARLHLNPSIQNPKSLYGTDADLRRLTKSKIKDKLIYLGYSFEELQNFSRWKMVGILKEKSSDTLEQTDQKYLRGERLTTKQQRQMYQLRINQLLSKQIDMHTQTNDFGDDESDYGNSMSQVSPLKALPQISDFMVTISGLSDVKNIKDIPGYDKILQVDPNRQNLACKVLRRVVKSLDNGIQNLKVQYSSDPKAVKKFMKRKLAYQSRRVVQRQKQQVSLQDFSRTHGDFQDDTGGVPLQNISSIIHIEQDEPSDGDVQMLEDNSTCVQILPQRTTTTNTVIKIPILVDDDIKPPTPTSIGEQTTGGVSRRLKEQYKVSLNQMLLKATEQIVSKDKLRLFCQRVKEKDAPGYFNLIMTPIDLSVIKARCKRYDYKTAGDFLDDVTLMAANAQQYNGQGHIVSEKANELLNLATQYIEVELQNQV